MRMLKETSLFLKGKSSRREIVIYVTVLLWLVVGCFTIINNADLIGMSAYFASLTPFVGSYIIGETVKEDKDYSDSEELIKS